MSRVWFTSDHHFGHARIIQYANRPFKNVDEMDETMIRNWQAVVRPEDTVYVLGDVAFYKNLDRTVALMRSLNGTKHLVCGNHDKYLRKHPPFVEDTFASPLSDLKEIKVQDASVHEGHQSIVLCHYALRTWNKSHFGSWSLFGHSHGSLPDDSGSLSLDVGVDCWNFAPVSYEMIRDRMKQKTFKPIDHHDRDKYKKS